MTDILYESDADLGALAGQQVAVVGYGNQGRSWALNLRDSGVDVVVCVRADETRRTAEADGFVAQDVESASEADVICILIPDDIIPTLAIEPPKSSVTTGAMKLNGAMRRGTSWRFRCTSSINRLLPRSAAPPMRE